MAFAEAVVNGDPTSLDPARTAVVSALGTEGMVDAAGVVSNFERMVRIADATGIELGAFLTEMIADARAAIGLQPPTR